MGLGILIWLKDNLSPSPFMKKSPRSAPSSDREDTRPFFRFNIEYGLPALIAPLCQPVVAEMTRNRLLWFMKFMLR